MAEPHRNPLSLMYSYSLENKAGFPAQPTSEGAASPVVSYFCMRYVAVPSHVLALLVPSSPPSPPPAFASLYR